ncbi:cytochrome b5 isoform Cb5-D [Thecamonas trahens ATCC 50062]|uniref:Cytochrome b5 isoform Cb5-D n=1 Tax=Thecamonas trahens ATCC 50062 TaxID=461836 RepID=A0A0L0DNE3_THETB|nr:cytochrome b5 isoform Cb5-D [Thecamonas trahens ATCC 50062]KNC53829.1 cytochrome b5 isoform Cb5-D [Thecamonas trahens ATCC 50062]|eukprot:XP_013754213.1 cytochrome b5 isoform Cb5-D [Thecamonas trahens ATCC 50062]
MRSEKPRLRKITAEEVALHDTEDDCWIIVDGKVYDVTSYVYEHPGGDIIADDAGYDATEGFDDADHSDEAVEEMAQFLIGELDESR